MITQCIFSIKLAGFRTHVVVHDHTKKYNNDNHTLVHPFYSDLSAGSSCLTFIRIFQESDSIIESPLLHVFGVVIMNIVSLILLCLQLCTFDKIFVLPQSIVWFLSMQWAATADCFSNSVYIPGFAGFPWDSHLCSSIRTCRHLLVSQI